MLQEVLLIDDDPAIHKLAAAQLSNGQTHLRSAFNGEQGLAAASDRKPDLILLDVDMPTLDGLEVCHQLKSNSTTHDIPVVFLTAATSTNDKIQGFEVGAVDYITKPFDPVELRARTKAALRAKYEKEELASKAMIDEETGLYNHAFLERYLPAELARARRSAWPLACLILEVDHFDEIVAEHGGGTASACLSHVASRLKQICRRDDLLCRHGATRFLVLAAQKDIVKVTQIADRMRSGISDEPFVRGDTTVPLSVSIGVAVSCFSFEYSIVSEAEDALLLAKVAGGDRVTFGGTLSELRLTN